jgi:hypothetical protein
LCLRLVPSCWSLTVFSSTYAVTAKDFETMRLRVCNAVNNLLLSVSWEVLGEEVVPQIFRNLCALYGNVNREAEAAAGTAEFALESSATNDLEVAATAAMLSALRRSTSESRQLVVAAEDAQLLLTCAAQGRSAESRLNAVGMIGCVGKRAPAPLRRTPWVAPWWHGWTTRAWRSWPRR